jgi:DNA/RNA endonuclease YhcR with UshA esterase domain
MAFVVSIFGIVSMIIFSGQLAPRQLHIKDINPGMLDEDVTVEGVVVDLKESPSGHTYFLETMDSTGKINVVVFEREVGEIEKNNLKITNLIKRRIKVLGTVTEYNGRLELILKDSKSLKVVV